MTNGGEKLLEQVLNAQRIRAHEFSDGPALFYRLEQHLDEYRKKFKALTTRYSQEGAIDFTSNDILSLSSSGLLRKATDAEMAKYPQFSIGSGGSRLLDGSNPYTEDLEARIAKFHNAEECMFYNSGFEANVTLFSTIPAEDDAIVYDELIHASVHDGMKMSKSKTKLSFLHNNLESFRETLKGLSRTQEKLRRGENSVLIAVETVYSMEGDLAPLVALVEIAKEEFPLGNASFVVDEAHATGLFGLNGRGLVSHLGLEDEIAIRMHTMGKAIASTGAIVLTNTTVKNYLVNFSRVFIYTTAPSFSTMASIKCAYDILESDETLVRQHRIQYLVRLLCARIRAIPLYERAKASGYMRVPVADGFEDKPLMSHIVPLWSEAGDALSIGLLMNKITAYPVVFPTVPRGTKRVRVCIHADNTEDDINRLVACVDEWLQERFKDDKVLGVEHGIAGTWHDFGVIKGKVEPAKKAVSFTDDKKLEKTNTGETTEVVATKLPEPYAIEVRELEVFNEKVGIQAVEVPVGMKGVAV